MKVNKKNLRKKRKNKKMIRDQDYPNKKRKPTARRPKESKASNNKPKPALLLLQPSNSPSPNNPQPLKPHRPLSQPLKPPPPLLLSQLNLKKNLKKSRTPSKNNQSRPYQNSNPKIPLRCSHKAKRPTK